MNLFLFILPGIILKNMLKCFSWLDVNRISRLNLTPFIYHPKLEVKETTDTALSASFLDLYLEFDDSGQLSTKFMINRTTSIFKSYIFQICAAIYQLLLHMVFTSRNWFVLQGPVAIILIFWNVIFIWETDYWTRAIKRFALFDLLKSLYYDTKILSKYIPSLQKRL